MLVIDLIVKYSCFFCFFYCLLNIRLQTRIQIGLYPINNLSNKKKVSAVLFYFFILFQCTSQYRIPNLLLLLFHHLKKINKIVTQIKIKHFYNQRFSVLFIFGFPSLYIVHSNRSKTTSSQIYNKYKHNGTY